MSNRASLRLGSLGTPESPAWARMSRRAVVPAGEAWYAAWLADTPGHLSCLLWKLSREEVIESSACMRYWLRSMSGSWSAALFLIDRMNQFFAWL